MLSDSAAHALIGNGEQMTIPWVVALMACDLLDADEREDELRAQRPGWATASDLEVIMEIIERSNLPRRTPLSVRLRTSGRPGEPRFRIEAEWLGGGGRRLYKQPARTGGLVDWEGDKRRLTLGQYRVLLRTEGERGPPRSRREDLLELADAQADVPPSDPGVILDKALACNPVLRVETIKPFMQPVQDGYQVRPRVDSVPPEVSDAYFYSTPTSQLGLAPLVTRTPSGTMRMIFGESARAGLRKCRELNTLTPGQAAHALTDPSAIFGDELDLSDFSERVSGLGPFVVQPFPRLREIQTGGWLDWDAAVTLESVDAQDAERGISDIDLKDDDVRAHLLTALALADQRGSGFVQHPNDNDVMIEVTPALREAVQKAERRAAVAKNDGKPPHEVLLVKDNFEFLAFDREPRVLLQPIPGSDEPPGLLDGFQLYDYQRQGFGWLVALYSQQRESRYAWHGALLADDMGLGKTLQILSFLSWVQEHAGGGPHLVVAPVGLLHNWEDESQRFFGTVLEPIHRVIGAQISKGTEVAAVRLGALNVALVSYETLRRHEKVFARVDWNIIVIDEAQKAKTPSSQVARVLRTLKAQFRVAVTGTPVENSLTELWTICDWALPGLLGSLRGFMDDYVRPLQQGCDTQRIELAKRLHRSIGPVFMRRLKKTVLADLPPITHIAQNFSLSEQQQERYRSIVSSFQGKPVLGALVRLFGVCAHPCLDSSDAELPKFDDVPFPRAERLFALLDDVHARGEKAIVFANRRALHAWLRDEIQHRYSVEVPLINGEITGSERRMGLIRSFSMASGFGTIVLAPKAAGVGLNITAANHVIHYTREWNPAVENQATDRAYRVGQKKSVYVHTFFANGTIEQRLDDLLADKRRLMDDFVIPMGGFDVVADELGFG